MRMSVFCLVSLTDNIKLARFFATRGDYKCFSVDDPGGLVVILQDLMSYEDDELRICSANLLYAIYKVE